MHRGVSLQKDWLYIIIDNLFEPVDEINETIYRW